MRRLMLAAVSWLAMSAAAEAACPATITDCPSPTYNDVTVNHLFIKGVPNANTISATDYGVKADGVTSNDVAMNAAVTACSAVSGHLILPPGQILMDGTGGQSIVMKNCHMEGAGVPAVVNSTLANTGTMFLFTSLTVRPFTCGRDWALTGINFYWPNQTNGTTVYPPFMSGDGVNLCGDAYIDKVVFVNPYQAFVQGAESSWENFIVSNSVLYATKDFFALRATGGSFVANNILAGPGPWFQLCPACKAAGGGTAASANASFLHALNRVGGTGVGISISITNFNSFNWAHFALLDAQGSIGNSILSLNLDGMLNIIDASSGGSWASQNLLTGNNSGCGGFDWSSGSPVAVGNQACFNMGANSALVLSDFKVGTSRGDMITFSGGSVNITGPGGGQVGQAADGGDYYNIHLTAAAPNASIIVKNATMGGRAGDVHTHGIVSAFPIAVLSVKDSGFANVNEAISAPYAQSTTITGNVSSATTGSQSVVLTGSGNVGWFANQFDKPPLATVANCGIGPVIRGTLRGTIGTGTGTVTSCQLQLPISPRSPDSNGACTFSNTTALVTGGSIGAPPLWNLSSGSNNIAGQQLNFNCGSE